LETQRIQSLNNFSRLEEFYFCHRDNGNDNFPEGLLVGLFQAANTKLRKIKLSYHNMNVINAIALNCLNIEILRLTTPLNRRCVLRVLSSCSKLKDFSFEGENGHNENDLFIQMAKKVPSTLEKLEIQMCLQRPWIFSPDSLKTFLKASNLQLLRIIHKEPQQTLDQQFSNPLTPKNSSMKTLTKDHLEVIKESGIGLYMTSGVKFSRKLYPDYVHTIEIPRRV